MKRNTYEIDAYAEIRALNAGTIVSDRVDESQACPSCHERRMDYIMIADNDTLRCQHCGTTYANR